MKLLIPWPPKKEDSFKGLGLKPKVKRKEQPGSLMGTGWDCANTALSCTDERERIGSVGNPSSPICPLPSPGA